MKLKQLCEEEKEKVKGQTRSLEVEKHDLLCKKKQLAKNRTSTILKKIMWTKIYVTERRATTPLLSKAYPDVIQTAIAMFPRQNWKLARLQIYVV